MKNKVRNISLLVILLILISLRLNVACTGLQKMNSEEGGDAEPTRPEVIHHEDETRNESEAESGDNLPNGFPDPAQIPEYESITAHHQTLREDGVLFVSSGNEPFWSFRLTGEKRGVFSIPEGRFETRVQTENPDGEKEHPVTIYHSDEMELRVRVEEGFCQDDMSGFPFTHKVSINFKILELTGCGTYL